MSAALKFNFVSVKDYLDGELVSPTKHEYVGGVVYAMAGARVVHNVIVSNIFGSTFARLLNMPCQPFTSDMKIRAELPHQISFYYPDVSIVCDSNPPNDSYQDQPKVIFEVLSKATRRIDEGEKRVAYLAIPSLSVYVLVEQEMPRATVFRRTGNGFVREVYEGLDSVLPLTEVGITLPLAEVYKRVEFVAERPDDVEL